MKTQGIGYITTKNRNGRKYYTGWLSFGRSNKKSKSSYNLKEVRDWIKEYNAKIVIENPDQTLKEAVIDFIEEFKVPPHVQQTTYEDYLGKVRIDLAPYPIADIKLENITPEMLENYQKQLIKDKGTSINERVMGLIKATLSKLHARGKIDFNPMTDIRIPKHVKKERRPLTHREQEIILSELDLDELKDFAIFFALMLGCRLGEICGLTWDDIKRGEVRVEEQFARVHGSVYDMKDLKTDSSYRIVPIPANLVDFIESKRKKGYIFSDDGSKPFDRKRIQRRYKKICKKHNIDSTFHCTRHTFATNLAEQNVSPFILKKILGHSKIETTLKYTHIGLNAIRETMNETSINLSATCLQHKE